MIRAPGEGELGNAIKTSMGDKSTKKEKEEKDRRGHGICVSWYLRKTITQQEYRSKL